MAIRAPAGVQTAPEEVFYPDSDGQGMPDGDPQRKTIIALLDILEERFRDDPSVTKGTRRLDERSDQGHLN